MRKRKLQKGIRNRKNKPVGTRIWMLLLVLVAALLVGCRSDMTVKPEAGQKYAEKEQKSEEKEQLYQESIENRLSDENGSEKTSKENHPNHPAEEMSVIQQEGTVLIERFMTPEGFERAETEDASFESFLRQFPLKEAGSPVLLHNGKEKGNQSAHAAVFALPIEDVDLQQCADSVMRIYAEYYWSSGQYEKIAFHFTNGFLCEYPKWRDGYRVKVSGNDVSWSKDSSFDDSYETFVKYLRMVFNYAGTLSMDTLEAETISLSEMQVGDVIIKGGSPGHVVLVVDMCENAVGEKAWLLAQGYMPAQEFHVINNPAHEDNPWYYESEITFPLKTAEYTFSEESMIKRLVY